MKFPALRVDQRVALLYLVFGGLWIFFSDRLLAAIITDASTQTTLQTYKGWAFVSISSLLIFALLRRELRLRRTTEGEFHESEERYRLLFENSLDAVLLTAPDGSIYGANPSACKMLERTEEEIKQLGRNGLVDETDPRLETALEERARTGSFHGELTLLRKDGTKFLGEISTSIFVNRQGNERTSMIIRDITERKQAEEALKESEVKFSAAFHSSPLALVITMLDGKFIEVNRAFCELIGYSHEEIIGNTAVDLGLLNAQDRERLVTALKSAGGSVSNFEVQFRVRDGSLRDILYSLETISFHGSLHRLSTGVDITERKQAEQALRESEQRLRQIWESTSDAMSISDANGIVLAVNPACFRLYGYTSEQIIGHSFAITLPEEAREQIMEQYKAIFLSGFVPPTFETVVRRADGTERVTESSTTFLINVAGERIALLSTVRDITERKRAEQQILRQLERLQALRTIDIAISSSFNLRLTLEVLLNQVIALLNVDGAAVLLFHPISRTLEYAATRGFRSTAIREAKVKFGEGYAGRAILERRPIHIPNLLETNSQLGQALLLNSEDFVDYYCVPLFVKGEVKGALEIFHRSALAEDPEWLDFLETLAGQAAIAIDTSQLFDGLQRSNIELSMAYDATIEGWSQAMDLRDKETEGHSQRVTEMTLRLAREMNISEADIVHIRRGALLHDIGKLGVPDHILLKPDKLTDEEWVIMRQHPINAYNMLSSITYMKPALDIPYCHHEKWDGTGYPRGLKGEQIPLVARIFAIVDVWDAVTSDRPYRPAWTKEESLEYIREESGKHFDPQVVEAFLKLIADK